MGRTYFDDSGQVYTEIVLSAKPVHSNWAYETIGNALRHTRYRSTGPGCSSLFNHSVQSFLANSAFLSAATLDGIPWSLASHLWSALKLRSLDSVKVWQAFVTAYPDAPVSAGLGQIRKYIERPQGLPLEMYTIPSCSQSGTWLTHLNLEAIKATRGEIIQGLARLTNLLVLSIGEKVSVDGQEGLDDSVLRAWGRYAREDPERRAFSMLRGLNLTRQDHITACCFEYLESLPKLLMLNLERCGLNTGGDDSGSQAWTYIGAEFDSRDDEASDDDEGEDGLLRDWDDIAQAKLKHVTSEATTTKLVEEFRLIAKTPRLYLFLGCSSRFPDRWKFDVKVASYMRHRETKEDSRPTAAIQKRKNADASDRGRTSKKRMLRNSNQHDLGEFCAGFMATS